MTQRGDSLTLVLDGYEITATVTRVRRASLTSQAHVYPDETPEPLALHFTLGRRKVRVGDTVRVLPSAPRKRDGYVAIVRGLKTNGNGEVVYVEVYPATRQPAGKIVRGGGYHALKPSRLKAMVQKEQAA